MKNFSFLLLSFAVFPFLMFGQTPSSSGTGFFVSDDGLIISCAHVIRDGTAVKVKINGVEYDAQLISKNETADLALIKINYHNPYH